MRKSLKIAVTEEFTKAALHAPVRLLGLGLSVLLIIGGWVISNADKLDLCMGGGSARDIVTLVGGFHRTDRGAESARIDAVLAHLDVEIKPYLDDEVPPTTPADDARDVFARQLMFSIKDDSRYWFAVFFGWLTGALWFGFLAAHSYACMRACIIRKELGRQAHLLPNMWLVGAGGFAVSCAGMFLATYEWWLPCPIHVESGCACGVAVGAATALVVAPLVGCLLLGRSTAAQTVAGTAENKDDKPPHQV